MEITIGIGYLAFVVLSAYVWTGGKHTGFIKGFMLCFLLTPLVAYFILSTSGNKNARGCHWCGNLENEAEFCGLCGKNEAGDIRPGFKLRN